jgi:hypothetical protein
MTGLGVIEGPVALVAEILEWVMKCPHFMVSRAGQGESFISAARIHNHHFVYSTEGA